MPKRLSPSQLESLIDAKLAARDFSPTRQGEIVLREYTTVDDNRVVVTSPAHDFPTNDLITAGTSSLNSVLSRISAEFRGQDVFIPLAECRGRQHWVLLHRDKQGRFHFYDPKRYLFYNTDHIFQGLLIDADQFYTGIQGFFDNTICGHVVTHLIVSLAVGMSLDDTKRCFNIDAYAQQPSAPAGISAALASINPYGTFANPQFDPYDGDDAAEQGDTGAMLSDDESDANGSSCWDCFRCW